MKQFLYRFIYFINSLFFIFKHKNAILFSGGRIIDPNSYEAEKWAIEYYEQIRHKSTDYIKIAKRFNLSPELINEVKEYLFNGTYFDVFHNQYLKFNPDPAIAQSWQRLAESKHIEPHDKTLLEHELLEINLKKMCPHILHHEVHRKASSIYNYEKEAKNYYDHLRKHQKNRKHHFCYLLLS